MPFVHPLDIPRGLDHPIDRFFSAPIDRYRVTGDQIGDGQVLTIVEVSIPTKQTTGSLGDDGVMHHQQIAHFYRAWIDVQQGATPVALHFWFGKEGQTFDEVSKLEPFRIMTTHEIKRLDNGAVFPSLTIVEEFNTDPKLPYPTAEEWAEVRAGKRKVSKVIHERETWKCDVVETSFPHDSEFFVLKFPEGQTFYDADAKKFVAAP
jgi:hypothetical protein